MEESPVMSPICPSGHSPARPQLSTRWALAAQSRTLICPSGHSPVGPQLSTRWAPAAQSRTPICPSGHSSVGPQLSTWWARSRPAAASWLLSLQHPPGRPHYPQKSPLAPLAAIREATCCHTPPQLALLRPFTLSLCRPRKGKGEARVRMKRCRQVGKKGKFEGSPGTAMGEGLHCETLGKSFHLWVPRCLVSYVGKQGAFSTCFMLMKLKEYNQITRPRAFEGLGRCTNFGAIKRNGIGRRWPGERSKNAGRFWS